MKRDRKHSESLEKMHDLVAQKDWSQTTLGPKKHWSQSLQSLVELLLDHPFPSILLWGPDLIQIYNDGYRNIAADKHPEALGQSTRECWPEAWHITQPIYEKVLKEGQSVVLEDQLFHTRIHEYDENAYFIFSYTPARNDEGTVAGIFLTIFETTERKEVELKLEREAELDAFRVKLTDAIRPLSDPVKIQKVAARVVGEHLGVDRAHYGEVYDDENTNVVYADYYSDEIASIAGVHQLDNFGLYIRENFQAGNTIVIDDFSTIEELDEQEREMYRQMNITAWVGVPLVKESRLRAYFVVNQSHIRKWTDLEIKMIEETAERTWATVERARAEQSMYASEARLDAFVKATSEVIYRMSPDWSEMYYLNGQEFIVDTKEPRKTWLEEYIPENEQPRVMEAIDEAIQTKSTFDLEHQVRQVDGTLGWTYSRAIPILDDEGEIKEWFGTATNITDRKQREQHDRTLLTLSDRIRSLKDPEEIGKMCTHQLAEELGLDRAYLLRFIKDREEAQVGPEYHGPELNPVSGVYPYSAFPKAMQQIQKKKLAFDNVTNPPSFSSQENKNLLELGFGAWAGVPLQIEDEKADLVLYAVFNGPHKWTDMEVTLLEETAERAWTAIKRARAEQDLRESEERLQMAQETAQLGSWELNVETKSFSCSPICKAHFGRAPEESFTYEDLIQSIHPDDWETKKQIMQNALETGEGYKVEYRIRWPDGTRRWIYTRAQVLSKSELVGVTLDITERKDIEEELEQRTRALQNSRMKLRSLVNELSSAEENQRYILAGELHDNLGQILDVCKLKFDLLMKQNPQDLPDAVHEIRELINKAIHCTRQLVNKLKPTPTEEKEDLDSALKWVVGKMEKYGLTVNIKNGDKHKGVDQRSLDTLIQVVQELLFNVVKHAETDHARLAVSHLHKFLQIKVSDEGKGFNPKHHKESTGQDGFGLFNVRQRIDLLGGTVNIESEPGKGTTAIVQIPTRHTDIPDQTSQVLKTTRKKSAVSSSISGITSVLVVDDHQMMREGIAGIIDAENDMLVANEASTGEEAISMVGKVEPDVVIMDINLPGMNGITATKKIKADYPNVKVIGVSFLNNQELINKVFNAGASDFISKDETLQSICQAIRESVSHL